MKKIVIRTLTGSVFVTLIIGSILLDPFFFAGLFLVFCIAAFLEFYQLFRNNEAKPQKVTGTIIGAIVYCVLVLISRNELSPVWLTALAPLIFIPFLVEMYQKKNMPAYNIALTLLPVLYIAVPFAALSFLFNRWSMGGEYFPNILIGFFIIIWTGDTLAYLGGMAFGKRCLFERISPRKTWEGCIIGAIFALGMGAFLSFYFTEFTLQQWVVMAAIIYVTSTLGDLAESMLKRSVQVKDSGILLPGHGGILDRFDGIFFSAPGVVLYIILLNHFS